MEKTFKHKCIKPNCPNTYEDKELDDYYCPSCNEARKVIASQVDKKLAGISKRPVESELARYDRLRGKFPFIPSKLL